LASKLCRWAAGIVELCAIKLAVRQIGQFLDIGRAEVVALDRLSDFVVLRLVAGEGKTQRIPGFS
jgi:hypothetical protein